MKASILTLRYQMKEVLKSLDRGEPVTLLYHGKPKGTIYPWKKKTQKKMSEHPFFGLLSTDKGSAEKVMDQLRGARYRAI